MSIYFEGPQTAIANVKFTRFPQIESELPFSVADIEAVENGLTTAMADMGSDAMLLEEREFIEIDPTDAKGVFIQDEDLAKGRLMSWHEVEFGQLVLRSESDFDMPTLVAVKPHVTREEVAHEWVMFDVFNSLSEYQSAYVPLGIWTTDNKAPHMVTLYEHGVQSMDNIFWPESKDAEYVESAHMAKAYQLGFFALGIVHGAGLIAHDMASVRNLARDSQRVRFIDLEQVEFAERQDTYTVASSNRNRREYQQDVTKLVTSSIQRGPDDYEPMLTETEPIVFQRSSGLLMRPRILDSLHDKYRTGVMEGMSRSGVLVDESLLVTRGMLGAIVKRAIDYELQRPIGPQPSIESLDA